jgi:hypothetical protein
MLHSNLLLEAQCIFKIYFTPLVVHKKRKSAFACGFCPIPSSTFFTSQSFRMTIETSKPAVG